MCVCACSRGVGAGPAGTTAAGPMLEAKLMNLIKGRLQKFWHTFPQTLSLVDNCSWNPISSAFRSPCCWSVLPWEWSGIWNLLHWDYAFWWFLKNTWRCRVKVLIKTLCPTSGAGQEGIHSVLLSYSLFNWTGDANVSIISAAAWGWESGHFGGHKCLCSTTERQHRGLHTWATVTNRFVVTVYRLYKVK